MIGPIFVYVINGGFIKPDHVNQENIEGISMIRFPILDEKGKQKYIQRIFL